MIRTYPCGTGPRLVNLGIDKIIKIFAILDWLANSNTHKWTLAALDQLANSGFGKMIHIFCGTELQHWIDVQIWVLAKCYGLLQNLGIEQKEPWYSLTWRSGNSPWYSLTWHRVAMQHWANLGFSEMLNGLLQNLGIEQKEPWYSLTGALVTPLETVWLSALLIFFDRLCLVLWWLTMMWLSGDWLTLWCI